MIPVDELQNTGGIPSLATLVGLPGIERVLLYEAMKALRKFARWSRSLQVCPRKMVPLPQDSNFICHTDCQPAARNPSLENASVRGEM
jgi:hypothetical protein